MPKTLTIPLQEGASSYTLHDSYGKVVLIIHPELPETLLQQFRPNRHTNEFVYWDSEGVWQ